MRVVVLGSANMDLVVRQPRWGLPGETLFGSGFSIGPGGKGLNQAVAAARAGATVSFIGAVGRDDFGTRLRAVLDAERIDATGLASVGEATGVAAITVVDSGENSIVVVAGANSESVLTDDHRARISAASHLVVQLERPLSLVEEAMRVAHAAGVVTVLTPAPYAADAERLLSLADILIPNEGEALALSGAVDAHDAAVSLSASAGTVIVTLGERGAVVASQGAFIRRVEPQPVVTVDTTGAGDTFAGTLVAWLARGSSLDAALDAATAAAAIAVTRVGAAAAMPYKAEIDAAISRTH